MNYSKMFITTVAHYKQTNNYIVKSNEYLNVNLYPRQLQKPPTITTRTTTKNPKIPKGELF